MENTTAIEMCMLVDTKLVSFETKKKYFPSLLANSKHVCDDFKNLGKEAELK